MFRTIKKSLLTLAFGLIISGCATPIPPAELTKIKTAVVVNSFAEFPALTLIGTTVFNNEFDSFDDPEIKKKLSLIVIERLKEKGIDAREVKKDDVEAIKSAQLAVEIVPNRIEGLVSAKGYGLYQRSLLGVRAPAIAYVSAGILHSRDGKLPDNGPYNYGTRNVFIGDLPPKWSALTEAKKKQVIDALNSVMQEVIIKTMSSAGL
jgi:hypothetical protein